MGGREPGGGQEQGWRLGAIPAPRGPRRAAGRLSGPYVRRAQSWPLGHRLPCRERNVCRGSGRRAPGCGDRGVRRGEQASTRDSERGSTRAPSASHAPHACDKVPDGPAEVFRLVAETPRLWHGADAPVRPACPEAGGWAVRPADTRGQAAPPPGAASLCREDRSRSPPPALPAPRPGLSLLCARPVSPSVGCGLHQGSTEHEPRGVPSGKVSVAEGTPQTPSPLWGSHATVA